MSKKKGPVKVPSASGGGGGPPARGSLEVPVVDPTPPGRNGELAAALRGYLNPLPISAIVWSDSKGAWEVTVG